MFVDYNDISDDAKVWVYPSSRKFYATEIPEIEQKIKTFIEGWKLEDENFKVSYQFLYNRFIVFIADGENSTISNTDIDTSVSFILELQEIYKVALLDKMNVCFKQGEFVQYKELKDFKKLVKKRAVTAKTIVFDNLITNNNDFKHNWEVPIEESWYNRFL
jgi:hypothetical protein